MDGAIAKASFPKMKAVQDMDLMRGRILEEAQNGGGAAVLPMAGKTPGGLNSMMRMLQENGVSSVQSGLNQINGAKVVPPARTVLNTLDAYNSIKAVDAAEKMEGEDHREEKAVDEGEANSDDLKEVHNSIKDSPNYPEGFEPRKNGTTKNTANNGERLEKLRKIESGTWKKIYKDGYDAYGNENSIHYFQSESGKVFDVKVKSGWSN